MEDVERFDDQCIVLRTGAGTLVVSGEGLHIGKLSLDGGRVCDVVWHKKSPSYTVFSSV